MADDALRVALIGYGLGGAAFHAPLVRVVPGLRLTTIVTGNAERQRQARADFPDARIVDSADALLDRPDDLDVVIVASPNRTHAPLALRALERGLHVVVDKPFTVTADEGRAVIDAARRHGRVLTVFQNRRWDGDFLTVRRLLREEALGPVLRFESRFERWRPVPKPGWRERGNAEEAGGILYDLGSHLIDQALALFGPVAQVYAELDRRRPGVQVDDDAFVALTHVSGVRSHLWMNALAAQLGPRLRVLGARAAYVKHGPDVQEEALRRGEFPADRAAWGVEPAARWGTVGAGADMRPVPTERGDYAAFYDGVVRAVREGVAPPVDPADAVAGLEIIAAARRSAGEGRVVEVEGRWIEGGE